MGYDIEKKVFEIYRPSVHIVRLKQGMDLRGDDIWTVIFYRPDTTNATLYCSGKCGMLRANPF